MACRAFWKSFWARGTCNHLVLDRNLRTGSGTHFSIIAPKRSPTHVGLFSKRWAAGGRKYGEHSEIFENLV